MELWKYLKSVVEVHYCSTNVLDDFLRKKDQGRNVSFVKARTLTLEWKMEWLTHHGHGRVDDRSCRHAALSLGGVDIQ